MPLIRIVNAETNEIIEREMNAQELAQWNADQENAKIAAEQRKSDAAAKEALLQKLGITEEEAKLLLA